MLKNTLGHALRITVASIALLAVTQSAYAQPQELTKPAAEPSRSTTVILNQALSAPEPPAQPHVQAPVILSDDGVDSRLPSEPEVRRPRGQSRSESIKSSPDKPLLEIKGF